MFLAISPDSAGEMPHINGSDAPALNDQWNQKYLIQNVFLLICYESYTRLIIST